MPDIKITVRDKVATGDGSRIVCGNSDYSILFDFDAEWDEYDVKTARFVYSGMTGKYIDVVFSGTTCKVPVLQDTIGVYVGVYAGELHTTTPAWLECDKSILCGGGSPAAPSDDVYNQIMERLNKLGTPDAEAIAAAVADYIAENPIEEKDPTVPAWAKAATKPVYTAPEVGADPAGTAASLVTAHNTGTDTHSDIRLLIQGLTDRLNALADSDDTTLDQLSEIVAYIKSNRDLIAAVTTDKVSVADIVDNLTTNVANTPLSAAQGVALKAMIDAINAVSIGAIPAPASATVGQTIRVSAVDENGQPTEWEAVDMGGAGGVSEWVKLFDITTSEDVMSIEQTLDFACDELLIVFSDLLSVTGNGIGVGVSINGYSAGSTKHGMLAGAFVHTTAQSRGVVQVFKAESMWYSIISGINSGGNSSGNGISRPSGGNGKTRIEEFCIWLSTPMTNSIKAGSKFAIYGR